MPRGSRPSSGRSSSRSTRRVDRLLRYTGGLTVRATVARYRSLAGSTAILPVTIQSQAKTEGRERSTKPGHGRSLYPRRAPGAGDCQQLGGYRRVRSAIWRMTASITLPPGALWCRLDRVLSVYQRRGGAAPIAAIARPEGRGNLGDCRASLSGGVHRIVGPPTGRAPRGRRPETASRPRWGTRRSPCPGPPSRRGRHDRSSRCWPMRIAPTRGWRATAEAARRSISGVRMAAATSLTVDARHVVTPPTSIAARRATSARRPPRRPDRRPPAGRAPRATARYTAPVSMCR